MIRDAAHHDRPPALRMRNLSKTFPGTRALRSVDLTVGAGEVRALLGENGSGKSTLIKVLAGYHRPDPGSKIEVAGKDLEPGSAESTYRVGCRIVHQELGLIGDLTVMDNLSFGSGFPTRMGSIREGTARESAMVDLAKLGLDIDPRRKVADFTPSVKTSIAVARALRQDDSAPVHLLVLDEPTATAPDDDVSRLLETVRLVAKSGIGVIYVTHRFDEVFEVADSVTVLRDGVLIATKPTRELDQKGLVHLLLGEELEVAEKTIAKVTHHSAKADAMPALEVHGLRSETLGGIDLTVQPGIILGVAGIIGSGCESLLATIYGSSTRVAGDIVVKGRVLPPNLPHAARQAGVAYLPPDRKVSGGFMDLDARENLMISRLRGFTRWGQIRSGKESSEVSTWMGKFNVAPAEEPRRALGTFSGGNQQKILFGKWLRSTPSIFLLDEPTQGVDVGAKVILHDALVGAASLGMAIIVSSTDVAELASICNVVIVLRQGRIVKTLVGDDITAGAISRSIIGSMEGVPI